MFFWSVIAVGVALVYCFRNIVPSTFVGVSHVVLVAESGARDPSVSIVDLPSIATSTVVLQRVRDSLQLPMSLINLKAAVSASVLGRSSIMAIGFRDRSSERAIAVSNAVSDQLSRYYDEISSQRYDVNVNRLSTELANEAARMRSIDQRMGAIAATNPFVISVKSVDDITTQIATLQSRRAEVLSQLQGDQAMADTTAPSDGLSKTARHEILTSDPAYQAVRQLAAKDSAELASIRAGYSQGFPGLPGAVAKVSAESDFAKRAEARALADKNAYSPSQAGTIALHTRQMAIVAGDQARLKQFDDLIASSEANLRDVPTTGNEYDQLRAQRDAVQTEYAALATRRANALANRAEASSLGSVVVLDRAIKADTQLAGSQTRAAAVAFVLILSLALGAVFMVESLDPRIRRPEEVEELYGIPVVAHFGARA